MCLKCAFDFESKPLMMANKFYQLMEELRATEWDMDQKRKDLITESQTWSGFRAGKNAKKSSAEAEQVNLTVLEQGYGDTAQL